MISLEISWREHIWMPDRLVLVTDLNESIIEVIQQWVIQNIANLEPPFKLEQMLSLVGGITQHIARSGTIQAAYTGKDYSDFVSLNNLFRNEYPFETVYIDIDSNDGVYFMIGALEHYGPRTTGDGFLSYDPNGFRKKLKKPVQESKPILFEDTLDIMEE